MKKALLASCAVAIVVAAVGVVGQWDPAADAEPVTVPAQPAERTVAAPPDGTGPPPLLPAADGLAPVTFTVETTVDGRAATTQIVTRTQERVRLVLEGRKKEWLFARNPVNRDRVSGYLIDHEAQHVLEHDDTDLLAREGLRGWADVIMMRFDPRSLPSMRATGEVEQRWGTDFRRFVAPDQDKTGVVEVWWSDALLLPLRITVRNRAARLTSTIVALRSEHDSAALDLPTARFSTYQSLDAADASDHRR